MHHDGYAGYYKLGMLEQLFEPELPDTDKYPVVEATPS